MWKPSKSNRFQSKFNNIGSDLVDRAVEGILILVTAERPELFGVPKRGPWSTYYAYEIGRSCRILYKPHYDSGIIEFARICSHKEY